MVEIANPKLSMNSHGAVDVRQRGLEGKRLLLAYVIVFGVLATQIKAETWSPTSKFDPIDAGQIRPGETTR